MPTMPQELFLQLTIMLTMRSESLQILATMLMMP